MSHFTSLKTSFQNLFYLENSLKRLNIKYIRQKKIVIDTTSKLDNINLLINQNNNSDIFFCWNGNEYELKIDLIFWEQPYSLKSFIDKIAQQYAGEVIIGESQKIGFQPIKYQQNSDGSKTLILERWNEKITVGRNNKG